MAIERMLKIVVSISVTLLGAFFVFNSAKAAEIIAKTDCPKMNRLSGEKAEITDVPELTQLSDSAYEIEFKTKFPGVLTQFVRVSTMSLDGRHIQGDKGSHLLEIKKAVFNHNANVNIWCFPASHGGNVYRIEVAKD